MTTAGPGGQRPGQQVMDSDLPRVRDLDSLKAITGWVTCRVVDDHALLHCKRCERGDRVAATPRHDFLTAVRGFVSEHETCA